MIPKNNARNLKENIQLKLIAHLKIKATKKITSINSMGPKNKHHPIPSTDSMDQRTPLPGLNVLVLHQKFPLPAVATWDLPTWHRFEWPLDRQHSCEKWWVTQGFLPLNVVEFAPDNVATGKKTNLPPKRAGQQEIARAAKVYVYDCCTINPSKNE